MTLDRRDFLKRGAVVAAGAAVSPFLHGCKLESRAELTDQSFHELRDRYFRVQLQLNPVTSTYIGGDGWDPSLAALNGRLRDYSAGGLADEGRNLRVLQQSLSSTDYAMLTPQARIDYDVIAAQLAFLDYQRERRYHERAVDTYVAEPFRGIDWQIQQMRRFDDGIIGEEPEWRMVVTRLAAIPPYLAVARENLTAGRRSGNMPDFRMVQRDGVTGSRANAEYFRSALPALARRSLGERRFAGSVLGGLAGAGESAARAYEDFAAWLERHFRESDRADRYAIGEAAYQWRIRTVFREARSPGDLFEYGHRQVEEYTRRIAEVAGRIASDRGISLPFGTEQDRAWSIRRVMEDLSAESPANDEELLRWYREAGERAVAFGRETEMFAIPPAYQLDVVPTPPALRGTIDAAYSPAPPLKPNGVGRFYLTPTGNDPAALREHARASVATTAIHEGFPGHDWHFRYMTEHRSQIPNVRWLPAGAVEDSSSMWSDSMATEGWALYSEELMAEPTPENPYGFYSAPEYLHMLQAQLLRAARVHIDVGLHTGGLSFDEAMDYFTRRVSFLPDACGIASQSETARAVCDGALRAIYRYSKWPTQAITYNLGKTAIVELREDYRTRRGASYSAREFHERFMRMGTIPPGFFRNALLG